MNQFSGEHCSLLLLKFFDSYKIFYCSPVQRDEFTGVPGLKEIPVNSDLYLKKTFTFNPVTCRYNMEWRKFHHGMNRNIENRSGFIIH